MLKGIHKSFSFSHLHERFFVQLKQSKYLLQNIQTNLYNIMNQINEVEYLLNEIKNEKKDSKNISDYNNILNMQQLMFQQQQQQMLIQQMLFQQHQMNVNHG